MTRTASRTRLGLILFTVSCASGPAGRSAARFSAQPSESAQVEEIAAGVTYSRSLDAHGPWAIHVLRIDIEQCRPALRAGKAGPSLDGRATTSALGAHALAAVNADFFELPGGRPVGAHVSRGEVRIGPGERPVLAVTTSGLMQGRARIDGWAAAGPDTVPVHQVNRRAAAPDPQPGATLITPDSGLEPAVTALRVHRVTGGVRHGRGVVRPPGGAEPAGMGPDEWSLEGAPDWMSGLAEGDTVEWDVRLVMDTAVVPVLEAVGGFPTLVRAGRTVLDATPDIRPDFGDRRHPRTAVGWNERSVFFVVVDGRRPLWSDGMSLQELADLFHRLGAREAINLDGGGSSAMVVRGETVNRPSDAAGERAVGNALLLERCL